MKKLWRIAFLGFIMINFSGEAMAGRLETLQAQFQQLHHNMKADTENKRGYTVRHIMHLMGIRSTLRLADGFDTANATKLADLRQKKEVNQSHLSNLGDDDDEGSQKSRAFFTYKAGQLALAEQNNSADPLFDLAEKEMAAFSEDGTRPLDAEKLQLWLAADEAQIALDVIRKSSDKKDEVKTLEAFLRMAKSCALSS